MSETTDVLTFACLLLMPERSKFHNLTPPPRHPRCRCGRAQRPDAAVKVVFALRKEGIAPSSTLSNTYFKAKKVCQGFLASKNLSVEGSAHQVCSSTTFEVHPVDLRILSSFGVKPSPKAHGWGMYVVEGYALGVCNTLRSTDFDLSAVIGLAFFGSF